MTDPKDSAVAERSSDGVHKDWEPQDPAGCFRVSMSLLIGLEALLTGPTLRVHSDYLLVEQRVARYTAKVHVEPAVAAEQLPCSRTAAAVRTRLRQTKIAFRAVDVIVAR